MSNKNIEMKRLNGQGEYDSLYPKTLSTNTIISDTLATEMGLESGTTVDEALMNKQDTLFIGTILASVTDLGEDYLPINSMHLQVKVEEYPELYKELRLDQLTSGWVNKGKAWVNNNQNHTKIGCNNGIYWTATSNGEIYYKESLDDIEETWHKVANPNITGYSSHFVDCVNNVWFICGRYSSSTASNMYIHFIKTAEDFKSGTWHQLSVRNSDDVGYVYKDVKYINDCYVFTAIGDNESYLYFSCYSSLDVTTPKIVKLFSVYGSSHSNAVMPQCIGVNGYWYCYYYVNQTNKYMCIYGADSFEKLQNITDISSSTWKQSNLVTSDNRILENVGINVFIEYKNQKYYIYTLTGVYVSDNPLSGFIQKSQEGIWSSDVKKNGDYYWDSRGITTSNSNNQYYEGYGIRYSTTPISPKHGTINRSYNNDSSSFQLKAFNYLDGIGYAIDYSSNIYINNGELYNLPYVISKSPIVYYIKAK